MHGFFLLDGMLNCDAGDELLRFTRKYWGDMVRRGATTFWEHFHLDWPPHQEHSRGLSACHGWSAAPTYHLLAGVLGVRPFTPGFGEILIEPQLGDLHWADGSVPTPHGLVRVQWRRSAERLLIELDVPRPAQLRLPLMELHRPRLLLNGKRAEPKLKGERLAIAIPAGQHRLELQARHLDVTIAEKAE
jgi:hypothetical protein